MLKRIILSIYLIGSVISKLVSPSEVGLELTDNPFKDIIQKFGMYETAAYPQEALSDLQKLNLEEGHRVVVYNEKDETHHVYDLFAKKYVKNVDRAKPNFFYQFDSNIGLSKRKLTKSCLNEDLGNPNSGICDYTGCYESSASNCNKTYFDCCINKLSDYNGRQECSNAICSRTILFPGFIEGGGCCDKGA